MTAFHCHRCGGLNQDLDYCPTCRIVELQAENIQLKRGLEDGNRVNKEILAENKRLRVALGEQELR